MTDATEPQPGDDPPRSPEPPSTARSAVDDPRDRDEPTVEPTAAFHSQIRAARTEFESQVAHARAEFDHANERIKERTGRDLIVATLIGIAIGVTLLASLLFVKWLFVVFAVAASILGTFEFTRALQSTGRRIDLVPQLAAGTALVISAWFLVDELWLHWVAVAAAVVFVVVWRLVAQMSVRDARAPASVLDDALSGGFLQLYVPFLTSLCIILLRQDDGQWWVLAFIIVVVASDTGAYASGLTFGKHPMAPRISPKKTWEGFAGAGVAALVAGLLLAQFMLGLPLWAGLILGAVILGTATVGDLGESMIKRDMGIKDMSSWLPGHGGVLDRLDSILPSTAAALALFYLLSPLAAT